MSDPRDGRQVQGRVLLVADSGPERERWRLTLQKALYEVCAVDEDEEACRQAGTWSPAVVLIDLDRSQGSGTALCRQLGDEFRQGFVPILLMTSRGPDGPWVDEGLAAGALDFVFNPSPDSVFLARVKTGLSLYEANVKLRQLIITDDVTGVFSRRFLFESMRHLAKQLSRGGPPVLACLIIDIDHFKSLNQDVGLLEADRVLKLVAQIIRRNTRDSDVVARFGGEEFAVILPATAGTGARITAEKIRLAVERETRAIAQVTVSIGVSWCDLPTEVEAQSLLKSEDVILNILRKADTALFRAKSQGRNRVLTQGELDAREVGGGIPILLEVVDRQAYFSTELALTGLAIQQDVGIREGDVLQLRLHLDEEILDVQGEVVWSGPVVGVGRQSCIKFVQVPSGVRERLDHFIGHRTQLDDRPELKA